MTDYVLKMTAKDCEAAQINPREAVFTLFEQLAKLLERTGRRVPNPTVAGSPGKLYVLDGPLFLRLDFPGGLSEEGGFELRCRQPRRWLRWLWCLAGKPLPLWTER